MCADLRHYRARQCPACKLRFPVENESPLGSSCPLCGAPTAFVDEVYTTHPAPRPEVGQIGVPLHVLVDNVRSLRNVGAIFRTADGVGVAHLHLCGITPTPAHPGLAKTALGAEQSVPWSYAPDAAAKAIELADAGHRLWALEGSPQSRSLFDRSVTVEPTDTPIVLVLGHEVSGVDRRILDRCERTLHIPMLGSKGSLNVAVAFGVAAYSLRFR